MENNFHFLRKLRGFKYIAEPHQHDLHRWLPPMASTDGFHRWHPPLASTDGIHRWHPPFATTGGLHPLPSTVGNHRWQPTVATLFFRQVPHHVIRSLHHTLPPQDTSNPNEG